jgi:hypothetical protein
MKQHNKKKGGGIFSKKEAFLKLIKKARSSEEDYINTYRKHVKASIKHAKTAEKHAANLKALDDEMPEGFNSFLTVFNNTVSPEIRLKKKADTTSPLLLRNYNIQSLADKDDLARDHLWHQCNYVLKTKFAPQDSVLVTKLNIADHNKSTFTLAVTGVTFGKDNKRTISHTNYVANLADIRSNLTDIIANIKKDVMEQVVQENVFAAPINTTPDPVVPGLGTPKKKEKADPIPDIYGVKALLNTPKIQDTTPQYGDNKPAYGEKKPEFGSRPAYLDQKPILIDKPPRPPRQEEPEGDAPPVGAPDNDFMKRHQPNKEFGNFGKTREFKPPRDEASGKREFKPRDRDRGSGDRFKEKRDSRKFSQKRHSGRQGSRKRSQGKQQHNRPNFRERGSHRRSNRFNKRHGPRSQKRSGSIKRHHGPPPPPPSL